jgi:DNA invertase Pin-like site-specific DNA recombinase
LPNQQVGTATQIFQAAMRYIEENGVKHLLVEKVDRHVRNLHDAVETHDWLTTDKERRFICKKMAW